MIISWVVLGFEALKHISECVVLEGAGRETESLCGAASLSRRGEGGENECKSSSRLRACPGLAKTLVACAYSCFNSVEVKSVPERREA